jgi:L-rhamnose-H+ transport protein
MLNFAYAFGTPIVDAAGQFGVSREDGLNALWLVALPAGGLLNVGYCLFRLWRQKTWTLLWQTRSPVDWLHALVMAGLWTGSVVVYGWGANHLGRLGPSLGWSLWNAVLIITTLICGLLTREWQSATGRPLHLLMWGILLLIIAAVVLGMGGAGG